VRRLRAQKRTSDQDDRLRLKLRYPAYWNPNYATLLFTPVQRINPSNESLHLINSFNLIIQIIPIWIILFNKRNLFGACPSFDLFLPGDGVLDPFKLLIPYKLVQVIPAAESLIGLIFVLKCSMHNIICHSRINDTPFPVSGHISEIGFHTCMIRKVAMPYSKKWI